MPQVTRDRRSADVDSEALAEHLSTILTSTAFRGARRHRRFLSYLVEHALGNQGTSLKETTLALDVFDRTPADYDPNRDTIVRVEARRLRERLQKFYRNEGATQTLELRIPLGSYSIQVVPRVGRIGNDPASTAELVERGMHLVRTGDSASLRKALQRFERAIEQDGKHAIAYLGLARARLGLVSDVHEPPLPGVNNARIALQRSLEIEPNNAEALILLGSVLHRYDHAWNAAQPMLRRAVRIAPQLPFAHTGLGFHLMFAGNLGDAEGELEIARKLDPFYLNSRMHMSLLRIAQRNWQLAEQELDAILDLAPQSLPARATRAAVMLYADRPDEALALYGALDRDVPAHPIGVVGCAQALAVLGRHAEAALLRDQLDSRFVDIYISPYQRALIDMRLGAPATALQWLIRAAEERDGNFIFAGFEPAFEPLSGSAVFKELVQRVR